MDHEYCDHTRWRACVLPIASHQTGSDDHIGDEDIGLKKGFFGPETIQIRPIFAPLIPSHHAPLHKVEGQTRSPGLDLETTFCNVTTSSYGSLDRFWSILWPHARTGSPKIGRNVHPSHLRGNGVAILPLALPGDNRSHRPDGGLLPVPKMCPLCHHPRTLSN